MLAFTASLCPSIIPTRLDFLNCLFPNTVKNKKKNKLAKASIFLLKKTFVFMSKMFFNLELQVGVTSKTK